MPKRYPSMIRRLPRGASRAELKAELARLEALEESIESWRGVTDGEKLGIHQRLGFLDRNGRDRERVTPRWVGPTTTSDDPPTR